MSRKLIGLIVGTSVAYTVGLVIALAGGSDSVKVAAIAVGGTAVGAVAGVLGSAVGAQAQASSARDLVSMQTDANSALKKTELAATRDQFVLQDRVAWAAGAYSELELLLNSSRTLGNTAANFDPSWSD